MAPFALLGLWIHRFGLTELNADGIPALLSGGVHREVH